LPKKILLFRQKQYFCKLMTFDVLLITPKNIKRNMTGLQDLQDF